MFQLDDGMYHVCVSDGISSGKQAQAESTLVVDLLEKLLEAGFSRESALKPDELCHGHIGGRGVLFHG